MLASFDAARRPIRWLASCSGWLRKTLAESSTAACTDLNVSSYPFLSSPNCLRLADNARSKSSMSRSGPTARVFASRNGKSRRSRAVRATWPPPSAGRAISMLSQVGVLPTGAVLIVLLSAKVIGQGAVPLLAGFPRQVGSRDRFGELAMKKGEQRCPIAAAAGQIGSQVNRVEPR